VDEVTFAQIEERGLEAWLAGLREEFVSKTYRPDPVRRVMIPKPNGEGERALGIPTIRDRVIQTAAKLVLEPIFEADFEGSAYGYRPARGAVDAVKDVHRHRASSHFRSTSRAQEALLSTLTAPAGSPPRLAPNGRACGGASIASGAMPIQRARLWPNSRPANQQRTPTRSAPASLLSRLAKTSANRAAANRGRGRVGQRRRLTRRQRQSRQKPASRTAPFRLPMTSGRRKLL
jgi:hypothetical protein